MQEHLTLFLIKEESKWSDEDVDSQAGKQEENLLKNRFNEDLTNILSACMHYGAFVGEKYGSDLSDLTFLVYIYM